MNALILPCWSVQSSFWWPFGKAVYIGWLQLECMNSCYIWTNKTGIWLSLQVLVTLQESLPLVTALPAKVKCFPIAISVSFCFVFLICVFIPGTTQMPTQRGAGVCTRQWALCCTGCSEHLRSLGAGRRCVSRWPGHAHGTRGWHSCLA